MGARRSTHRTPARDNARTYLFHLLRGLQPGDRLPGLLPLAAGANVAPTTMQRVLQELRQSGHLFTRPRSGTYKALSTGQTHATGAETSSPSRRHRSVEVTAQRLARDMLAGRIAAESRLPPLKELRALYGVSRGTLTEALASLEADGWVQSAGRSWQTTRRGFTQVGATVVLIARDEVGGASDFARAQDHIRYLQRECAGAHVNLRLVPCAADRDPMREVLALLQASSGAVVVGLLVWTLNLPDPILTRILHGCRSLSKPVAVFDELDGARSFSVHRGGRTRRAFVTTPGERAGYEMGRMLSALGHARIAYFSDRHNCAHSQARLAGLTRAVQDAGGEQVVPFVTDDSWWQRQRAALGRRRDALAFADREAETLEQPPARVAGLVQSALTPLFRRRALMPLMERCLRDDTATAWVAHNDLGACYCLDFLAERGVKAPGEISVAGFDDTPSALGHDLTSFDFGGRAAAHAAVTFLLRPESMRGMGPVYEASGRVVVRGSTGPMRGGRGAGR